jgi:hypothetical protein
MGGAAVSLLANDPARTEDVDLVIRVDQRMITADRLTTQLITFPSDFVPIGQSGHTIPAYKLRISGGGYSKGLGKECTTPASP